MRKLWFLASSCDTLLCGSSASPNASACAMHEFTHAGVAAGSTPGVRPLASPSSMRSTQNVHLVATARRVSSRRLASLSVALAPYAKVARSVL